MNTEKMNEAGGEGGREGGRKGNGNIKKIRRTYVRTDIIYALYDSACVHALSLCTW